MHRSVFHLPLHRRLLEFSLVMTSPNGRSDAKMSDAVATAQHHTGKVLVSFDFCLQMDLQLIFLHDVVLGLCFAAAVLQQLAHKLVNSSDSLTVGFIWTSDGVWSPMDNTVSPV